MNLEINKEYNLAIKNDNKYINVGTIKKYIYDNEVFYLVKRVGMNDTCYNHKEINDFLKNNYYVEI